MPLQGWASQLEGTSNMEAMRFWNSFHRLYVEQNKPSLVECTWVSVHQVFPYHTSFSYHPKQWLSQRGNGAVSTEGTAACCISCPCHSPSAAFWAATGSGRGHLPATLCRLQNLRHCCPPWATLLKVTIFHFPQGPFQIMFAFEKVHSFHFESCADTCETHCVRIIS